MTFTDTRLKHLCADAGQYGLNVSALDYSSGGYRLIRTSDIDETGRLRPRDGAVFVDVHLDKRHELSAGDLLLSRSGTIGRALLLGELEEPSTYAGYLVRFRPRPHTDSRFLAYVAASKGFQAAIEADAVTSTIQNFNAERYANISVLAPPLDEQRRIADFLDAETARIDKLATLQSAVRSSVMARIQAHLDLEVDELASSYGTLPFRRLILSIEQGSSPQCDNFPASTEDWGVLKVSAVKNGRFLEDENKQLPTDIEPERRYEIRHGDLLITRANTPQLVGAAAVADSPRPRLMLCDKIFRVTATADLVPEFLVFMALGTRIRDMCAEASHGTSQSMANLKTEEIKRWPIPAAPVQVQRNVVAELSEARDHAASLTEAIDRQLVLLAERRQAVITAAVTGGISV
jgi:type I restriction enzyme, S subunit